MNNRILKCRECGIPYFNWKKLSTHLINKHGYSIPLPEETNDEEKEED